MRAIVGLMTMTIVVAPGIERHSIRRHRRTSAQALGALHRPVATDGGGSEQIKVGELGR